jgi:hypothetical protein
VEVDSTLIESSVLLLDVELCYGEYEFAKLGNAKGQVEFSTVAKS